MKNYINKNIDNQVKWSREITRKRMNGKKPVGKIKGLYMLDKDEKSSNTPSGYCASIELDGDGNLAIFTNGKYQFIEAKIAEKLICELIKRIS